MCASSFISLAFFVSTSQNIAFDSLKSHGVVVELAHIRKIYSALKYLDDGTRNFISFSSLAVS